MFAYSEETLTPQEVQINEHFKTFPLIKSLLEKINNFSTYLKSCCFNKELLATFNPTQAEIDWVNEKADKFVKIAEEKPIMVVNMIAQFLPFFDSKTKEFDVEKFEHAYPILIQTIKMIHAQKDPEAPELVFPDLAVVPKEVMAKVYRYAGCFCDIVETIAKNTKNQAKK